MKMKDTMQRSPKRPLFGLLLLILTAGCGHEFKSPPASKATALPDPCAIVLVPQAGDQHLHQGIARFQREALTTKNPNIAVERLRWVFVAKAPASFHPRYFKPAPQCPLRIASK